MKYLKLLFFLSLPFLTFSQNIRISDMPTASNLTGAYIPIIQGGVNKKAASSLFGGGSGGFTLTTIGNSGSSTFSGGVLNIPTYTLSGLGGITLNDLSAAAGSGAYNSATGVITIPTNNNQLTNGAGYITSFTEVDPVASAINGVLRSNGTTLSAVTGTGYSKFSSTTQSFVSTIPNSDLTNSAITINGISTALGSSITQDQITGLSLVGLVKRTGTNTLSVAVAGVDYQSAITFGTGVQSALGVNIGSAGAPVLFNGAGGTPSSLTLTNATGLPAASVVAGALTNGMTATTQAVNDNSTKISTTAYLAQNASPLNLPKNTQTSNYTAALTDVGKIIEMNIMGTANTVTIPPNASVAFPVGTQLIVTQYGTGITSLIAGAGVTFRNPSGSLSIPAQYAYAWLWQRATDEWEIVNGASIVFLTNNILATTTNDNATASYLGEYVNSLVASGSAVSLSNNTPTNVTSISLTAGDWDVVGGINLTEISATVTARSGGSSSTSATVPNDGSETYLGTQTTTITETNSIPIIRKRFSLSATTTIYLVVKVAFSAGTVSAFGTLNARRPR